MLANTNLDDNKQTKQRMLENVDIDYQNALRSIYNIVIDDGIDQEDPFFKAMRIPGRDYDPGEEKATDPIPHDLKPEIEVDQGGS